MLEQYQEFTAEEKERMQEMIRRLLSQTFLLERKYEKKGNRMLTDSDYYFCERHMDFLQAYFEVAGIRLCQDVELGVLYLRGAEGAGERLTKLATIYLLVLKLIYDEKMAAVSSSVQIATTVGELNGKVGEFRLVRALPSLAEQKRAFGLLRKYQMAEFPDTMEELGESSRILIYPCINLALQREDMQELLRLFEEAEETEEGTADAGI